jgi:HEPN domain-containing protein
MEPPREETGRILMSRAEDDLTIVHQLLESPKRVTWAVAFHAQQACEKAIKAVLWLYTADNIPKTHDVGLLAGLAARTGIQVPRADFLSDLTAYAAATRYNDPLDPGDDELAEAVAAADAVVEWARPLVAEKLAGTEHEDQS